jgi:hypothetical protein
MWSVGIDISAPLLDLVRDRVLPVGACALTSTALLVPTSSTLPFSAHEPFSCARGQPCIRGADEMDRDGRIYPDDYRPTR